MIVLKDKTSCYLCRKKTHEGKEQHMFFPMVRLSDAEEYARNYAVETLECLQKDLVAGGSELGEKLRPYLKQAREEGRREAFKEVFERYAATASPLDFFNWIEKQAGAKP